MKRIFTYLLALSISYSVQAQLIINEVLYDPSNNALDGDANGDGVYGQEEDSFIEFLNNSANPLDVSGYQIWDDTVNGSLRYTISANTIIPAWGALVVFGGGTPTGTFGGSLVQVVNNGTTGMNLNNSGEVIVIKDALGNTVLTFDSDALSNNPNESYTRNPDYTGSFEQHADNKPRLFSPGMTVDSTVFSGPPITYDITFNLDLNQYGSSFTDVFISGSFNGYCTTCDTLKDGDANGVYDITLSVDSGDINYSFVVDNSTESLSSSNACAEDVSGTYYRAYTASAVASIPAVCWESCSACPILVTSITVDGTGGVSTITSPSGTLQMVATVLPANATDNTVSWSTNNSSIATIDVNGLLTAVGNGIVTVTATANDASSVTGQKDITISNQSSSVQAAQNNSLAIYPNPAKSSFSIVGSESIDAVVVYSLDGKKLLEFNVAQDEYDISVLKPGFYIVHALSSEGTKAIKLQKN